MAEPESTHVHHTIDYVEQAAPDPDAAPRNSRVGAAYTSAIQSATSSGCG
jgi:hypothetical protein